MDITFSFSNVACACTPATPVVQLNSDAAGEIIEVDTSYEYTLPAKYLLEKVIVFYPVEGTLRISKVSAGDEDILPETTINAVWNNPIVIEELAGLTSQVIYFTDMPAGSKLIIIRKKIKIA